MRRPIVLLTGVVAVAWYVATVIIGGAVTPGYSHVGEHISALTQRGAEAAVVLNPMFAVYNALVVVFGIALLRAFGPADGTGAPARRDRWARIGAVLVIGIGMTSIAMWWFPMDPIGAEATGRGAGHLVLAGVVSLSSIGAITALGPRLGDVSRWLRTYSWISAVFVFITGGAAALLTSQLHPLMGLAERLTIGGWLQWLVVVSVALFRWSRRAAATPEVLVPRERLLVRL